MEKARDKARLSDATASGSGFGEERGARSMMGRGGGRDVFALVDGILVDDDDIVLTDKKPFEEF